MPKRRRTSKSFNVSATKYSLTNKSLRTEVGVAIGVSMAAMMVCILVGVTFNKTQSSDALSARSHHVVDRPTKLMLAAYTGDADLVKRLLQQAKESEADTYIALLEAVDRRGMATLHYALEGRNNDLQRQSMTLHGNHEDVTELLASDPSYNNSLQCPIYYAVHYRNMKAIESLVRHTSADSLMDCLLQQDLYGYCAVHVAARSKASGFARFFLRLFDKTQKQIRTPHNTKIFDLLGLTILRVETNGKLTFNAITDAISARDMELLLQVGESSNRLAELLQVQDHNGNTPLHLAAASGKLELVRLLVTKGSAHIITSPNSFGYTPASLALARGFTDVHRMLMASVTTDGKETNKAQQPINEGNNTWNSEADTTYTNDSWNQHHHFTKPLPSWLYKCGCQLKRLNDHSSNVFYHEHIFKQQPVILRFTGLNTLANTSNIWNKENFLKKYGNRQVTAASIPYADLYGLSQETHTTTVYQFVEKYMDPIRPSNSQFQPYIFDARLLHTDTELRSEIKLPALFNNYSVVLRQFIMGPPGSGSPPHFHGNAYNTLIIGRKLWFLYPTIKSYFSRKPIFDWLNEDWEEDRLAGGVLICTQEQNDVIFVPENWGHAVINLENSIAVAIEFNI